ncbi:MAG: hypothetical protein EOO28_17790 [Comamonadaceae bacterium]|nr:MAG: hypothetical protein EOO28_17790 [Comamonadaceae bacterium]
MQRSEIFQELDQAILEQCGTIATRAIMDTCRFSDNSALMGLDKQEAAFLRIHDVRMLDPRQCEALSELAPAIASEFRQCLAHVFELAMSRADSGFSAIPLPAPTGNVLRIVGGGAFGEKAATRRLITLVELVCQSELSRLASRRPHGSSRSGLELKKYRVRNFVDAIELAFNHAYPGQDDANLHVAACSIAFARQLRASLQMLNVYFASKSPDHQAMEAPDTVPGAYTVHAQFAHTEL